MENKTCAYCNKPIVKGEWIYKYFPDDKIHKPVHFYHLKVKDRKEPTDEAEEDK